MFDIDLQKRVGESSFAIARKRVWRANGRDALSRNRYLVNDVGCTPELRRPEVIVDPNTPYRRLQYDSIHHR
jgi:hypothetical protein